MRRREALSAEGTTFYRAAHTTETAGQYSLDIAGDVGVLSLYHDYTPAEEMALAEKCRALGILQSLYLKRRPPAASHRANTEREYLSPPMPLFGPPVDEVVALEDGVPYVIRPASDLSIGLFSDARLCRRWVREHAPQRVLNTFAYTCGFGLNAALGGATVVKNVDLSRKVLAWGQENYALSALEAPDYDFLQGDSFEWLRRLHKRGELFDLVILDPPSFARSKRQTWRAERDYSQLVAQALAVTAPGGALLCMTNHAGLTERRFEQLVQMGATEGGRTLTLHTRLTPGADYPQAQHLKASVWREVGA